MYKEFKDLISFLPADIELKGGPVLTLNYDNDEFRHESVTIKFLFLPNSTPHPPPHIYEHSLGPPRKRQRFHQRRKSSRSRQARRRRRDM